MQKPKKRKIIDIDVEEISLVDSAANRRKFYLKKRGGPMDKIKKLLKAILGADPTEAQIQKAQAMPSTEAESLLEALTVLEKYQDNLPEDLGEATLALTKFVIDAPAAPAEDAPIDFEKFGAKLSKATKDELTKIKSIVDKMLQADTEEAKKYAGLPEDVKKRLEALDEAERIEKASKAKAGETELAALRETVKAQGLEIEKMKKRRVSKQATGEAEGEPEDLDKAEKVLWPSLAGTDILAREDE